MKPRHFRSTAWWVPALLAGLSGLPFAACATSMQVAPVRVVLSPGRPVAAMTIGNGEDGEIAVQAEVFAWSQDNGRDVYEPTRDVLVNPTIFRVPAQGQQIVRVGLQVAAGDKERSYRIFLRQLPRDQALPTDAGAGVQLQTLLRIGVPIFVAPTSARPDIRWRLQPVDATPTSGRGARYNLVVDNRGSEHLQLTHVAVRREAGAELARKSMSQYVLAGETTAVALDLPPLEADTQLQIETQSDAPSALPAALVRVPRADAAPR